MIEEEIVENPVSQEEQVLVDENIIIPNETAPLDLPTDSHIHADELESSHFDYQNCSHLTVLDEEPADYQESKLPELQEMMEDKPLEPQMDLECPACLHVASCPICQKYEAYLLEAQHCPACLDLFYKKGIALDEIIPTCKLESCPFGDHQELLHLAPDAARFGVVYQSESTTNSQNYDELIAGDAVNTKRGFGGGGQGSGGSSRFVVDDATKVVAAVTSETKDDEEVVIVTTEKSSFWGLPSYILYFIIFALIAAIIIAVIMLFVFGASLF
ncbi:Uncharacterised protein [Mesomycoplasma conjunctivae]|uniref:Uncharacterized protein n=1 Tax=Mesomycoplasma conjunctivae (strain ATCC 25834 / NCTC 10147 / HRC/581) TaxID=572263 RepID=C5J692_MESCH|nr:hypothetical protein [Mesomycoplasma conjunctivae]CAT04984.1 HYPOTHETICAL PROTEIN MCJ_002930 [Mesomycoplasma conjunctivae]VEU66355.1 Uncharacterised protein [Mesomycoplasma conjunctivae]